MTELEPPEPADHEILVKVHATTVSVADQRIRSFRLPLAPLLWLPARIGLGLTKPRHPVLGMELSGTVERTGRAVERFCAGDEVYAAALAGLGGGYAEYVCLPETGAVAMKPRNASHPEAAAVPIGGRTALFYLRKANVGPGQDVLVYGASGSVGTYAVQLAKHLGARVTGVCSTPNLPLVESLGADRVIDYTKEDFARRGERYDVVFDTVDKCPTGAWAGALKRGGFYLNATVPLLGPRVWWSAKRAGHRLVLGQNSPETPDALNELGRLIETGALQPVIDRRFALEEIVDAHRYVDLGHKRGNVVVSVFEQAAPAPQGSPP